ncbi:hypothetical protein ALC57_02104 [Trachymyrmex cornetzi]|uniref:Uncharacterized protein n=1 Tax=Trachymyrmex cornetzi TaxID=471704 RepID=A0A151JNY2_9HYME|nr:hypothetical protein ALC57_02104 [Trachymyrmex cornetzi]
MNYINYYIDKSVSNITKNVYRLDDITFRRSHNYKSRDFSIHKLPYRHNITKKYEDTSSIHLQESETEETESYQIQFCHDEYKSKKPQNKVHRMPTVFGERLYKRIIEDKKEEENQTELINLLAANIKTKDISKENIIENDKKAGSPFGMNNNDNDSNIGRCSSSEPSYRKNLMKRTNEEDNTSRHKRIKIEKNEEETITKETNYNYLTQYDLTDNFTQYDMKDNLKFEDQLDVVHSFKKEEVSVCDERRAASEYRDTKENRSCTNGRRSETRSKSAKDHDSSYIKNSHAHSLRNFRTSASHTTRVSERFDSDYRKNGHRYSPPRRRSYSRSRSDYESSSSHRLREKSSRTYREAKYDNYKYDSRYRYDRLKRNCGNEEDDRKTRYRREKYDDVRDKYRYSSSDAEDKESNSSYKNKKHENRRTRKEKASILDDKKLLCNDKVETNLRESSSRTIVNNTMNFSVGKNVEQHKVKNESEIKLKDFSEVIPIHIVKKDLEHVPEEGEILDSPKKKDKFTKISAENRREKSNVKIVPVEDKNEDISVNSSIDNKLISLQNDTKQLEVADISTKKIEVPSRLVQENSKDCEEIIQSNLCKNHVVADKINNCIKDKDKCKFLNKNLMEPIVQNIGITEQVRDSDIDNSDKNNTNNSKDSITEIIKIKETIDFNIDSVTKIKEIDDSSIEGASKKDINNLNIGSVVEITEMNNFNNSDSIHKIGDELRISTAEVTKVEAMLNCDIEDRDKSQASLERETFHQMSNKSVIKTCLNDHNYVQNSSINVSNLDAIQKPSLRSERNTAILDTATSKETKVETINVQSAGVKKTISIVKNKKDQQSRGILISHRRKAVILSDSNASMTVLMNTVKTSSVTNSCNNNDSTLKPRACKISRMTAKATCK